MFKRILLLNHVWWCAERVDDESNVSRSRRDSRLRLALVCSRSLVIQGFVPLSFALARSRRRRRRTHRKVQDLLRHPLRVIGVHRDLKRIQRLKRRQSPARHHVIHQVHHVRHLSLHASRQPERRHARHQTRKLHHRRQRRPRQRSLLLFFRKACDNPIDSALNH